MMEYMYFYDFIILKDDYVEGLEINVNDTFGYDDLGALSRRQLLYPSKVVRFKIRARERIMNLDDNSGQKVLTFRMNFV